MWSRLTGYEPSRRSARSWLLRDKDGARSVREDNDKILGDDPTIAETLSLEPGGYAARDFAGDPWRFYE